MRHLRLFQIRRVFFQSEITPGESREEMNGNRGGQDPYRITICPLCVQTHTIHLLGIPLPNPSEFRCYRLKEFSERKCGAAANKVAQKRR